MLKLDTYLSKTKPTIPNILKSIAEVYEIDEKEVIAQMLDAIDHKDGVKVLVMSELELKTILFNMREMVIKEEKKKSKIITLG